MRRDTVAILAITFVGLVIFTRYPLLTIPAVIIMLVIYGLLTKGPDSE